MFKKSHQTGLTGIYLPIPNYFRQTDLERLCRAFKNRKTLYGYHNPFFQRKQGESIEAFFTRFRVINPAVATHLFTNFILTEKGIKADITFIDEQLANYEGNFTLGRRANNDYWFFAGQRENAPGFFGFDIFTDYRGMEWKN